MTNQQSHNILRLSDTDLTLATPAEDIRGRKVFDANEKEIGQVDDLMIDDTEKKVRFIRVASGGFLGMGQTKFLIPVDAIVRLSEDAVRVNRDREHVSRAPTYDPDLVDEVYLNGLYGYYGFAPFWSAGYMYPTYPFYL